MSGRRPGAARRSDDRPSRHRRLLRWPGGGSVWLLYHGYPRLVAATAILGFIAAAACVGHSWRERIALALTVPYFVAGGVAGFFVYLAMFSLPWFEAIFNDKGSGPLGLLLFVCGFSVAGVLAGGWVLERAFHLRRRQGTAPII
jgi:hypothetical protein